MNLGCRTNIALYHQLINRCNTWILYYLSVLFSIILMILNFKYYFFIIIKTLKSLFVLICWHTELDQKGWCFYLESTIPDPKLGEERSLKSSLRSSKPGHIDFYVQSRRDQLQWPTFSRSSHFDGTKFFYWSAKITYHLELVNTKCLESHSWSNETSSFVWVL
jgi:hypothetical protein